MDPRRPPARQDGAIRHDHRARRYGVNKARFPGPVPVGAKVRAVITLAAATRRDSGIEATFGIRDEVQGAQRPPCVAETVYLYS
jgi:acyl dehydratase